MCDFFVKSYNSRIDCRSTPNVKIPVEKFPLRKRSTSQRFLRRLLRQLFAKGEMLRRDLPNHAEIACAATFRRAVEVSLGVKCHAAARILAILPVERV